MSASTAARRRSTTSNPSPSRRPFCAAAPTWFAGFGRPNNTGTKLFCVSGHVNKPATFEEEMGFPSGADRQALRRHSRRLGQSAGGDSRAARRCPAAGTCDQGCPMDFDTLRGWVRPRHGGVIVMDKSTDIIKAIARLSLLLQARELRPVHAVPRRHRLDVAVMERMAEGRSLLSRRSTCCWRSPSRSKATRSAPSAMRPPGRSRA
jgi:NADH:ubiquinone oxidoreductase subunit F (NADH-binding)